MPKTKIKKIKNEIITEDLIFENKEASSICVETKIKNLIKEKSTDFIKNYLQNIEANNYAYENVFESLKSGEKWKDFEKEEDDEARNKAVVEATKLINSGSKDEAKSKYEAEGKYEAESKDEAKSKNEAKSKHEAKNKDEAKSKYEAESKYETKSKDEAEILELIKYETKEQKVIKSETKRLEATKSVVEPLKLKQVCLEETKQVADEETGIKSNLKDIAKIHEARLINEMKSDLELKHVSESEETNIYLELKHSEEAYFEISLKDDSELKEVNQNSEARQLKKKEMKQNSIKQEYASNKYVIKTESSLEVSEDKKATRIEKQEAMRTNYETNKKEATVKKKSEIINITCSEAKTHKKELSKSEESTNKTKTKRKEAHKTEASKSKVITESEVINKTEALTELEADTKSETTETITKSEATKAITTSEAITKAEAIKPETIESEAMIRQKNYRKPNKKGDNESSTRTKSEANSGTTHKSEDKRKLIVEATLDIRKTKFQKNEDEAKLEVKEVLLQKTEAETKLEVQEAKFQKDKAEAKLDEEVMLQKNEAEEKFEALILQKNEAETKLNIQEAKFQVNEAVTKLEVQETRFQDNKTEAKFDVQDLQSTKLESEINRPINYSKKFEKQDENLADSNTLVKQIIQQFRDKHETEDKESLNSSQLSASNFSPSSLTNLSETFQKSLTEDEAIEVFLLSRHFEYDCAKPLKVLPPPNVTIFEFDEKKMKRRIEAIEACPLKKSVRFNIEESKEFCFSPFNCSSEEEEEKEADEEREEDPSLVSPPKFSTKEREIVAELNKRLFVHLELVSAVEPKMSIYHNDMHLGDDPSKCRFLVDKNGNCWEIMLIFPNFDTELVGDYVFIASNEGGFDKSKITLKLEEEMATDFDVLQKEEEKTTPKTSTNTNKTLKQIKITTNDVETTQNPPSQNFNKTPKIIEKPPENLELNLNGKEFLNFVIEGDPLPHIEMWIEKQSGNCKIIEPWRKFKLERLQQNKLGVTLLQKSLKLIQVGDIIVLQAINVFGEIITKHVVLNVLSNVLSNVSLLNKQVFVKEQPKIQQEETAPDSPKISGEKRDEEKKKKKIPSALFIPKASFKGILFPKIFVFRKSIHCMAILL